MWDGLNNQESAVICRLFSPKNTENQKSFVAIPPYQPAENLIPELLKFAPVYTN